jgi:hypothetical protein
MTALPEINLSAKQMSQLDSDTDEALRMCNSSANCGMAYYLTHKAVEGPYAQSDDNYLKCYVEKYGDSTDPQAQVLALADLGVKARFSNQCDLRTLVKQLEAGVPVPVGILHHGGVSHPTGGGHWILVKGITADARAAIKAKDYKPGQKVPGYLYVNDPAGELDLVGGGYHLNNNGANLKYGVENFSRRWMCGPTPGVYQFVQGTGWAILATKP